MAEIKNLSYRTLDELIDAVRTDLKSFNQSGDIDTGDLIKIAQKVNYELGLKIYMPKQTVIEIAHRRAKLPADFYQLQLALICYHYKHVQTAPWNGNVWLEEIVTQTSGSNCDICEVVHQGPCPIIVANPYVEGGTRTICNGQTNIKVLKYCQGSTQCFEQFERLYILPSRWASGFCLNTQFRDACNQGQIKGNFIETTVETGKLYIAYLGGLEDDDGNLLVLDHPKINLYYEWSMKHTILENMWLNGEDMLQRMQYAEKQRDEYRHQALSIANMPSYRECLNLAQVTRNIVNDRYMNHFLDFRGNNYYYNNYNNVR